MRSSVHDVLPPKVRRSLEKFGADLALARRKRRVTTAMTVVIRCLLEAVIAIVSGRERYRARGPRPGPTRVPLRRMPQRLDHQRPRRARV